MLELGEATTGILRADAGRLPVAGDVVDCIVTSPPYGVGMAYDGVTDTFGPGAYEALAEEWAGEMARVLRPGGRAWVNVPPSLPVIGDTTGARWNPAGVWLGALTRAGLSYRDTVVWEQEGEDAACAWGSYLSPNAPNLRGRHEVVLSFFKDSWARGRTGRNEIDPADWPVWTRNVWRIPTAARRWHPCPFPGELVRRAVLLSTWRGDLVLDPFAGSGTTMRVAHELGRRSLGCELSAGYCDRIRLTGFQGAFDLSLVG